MSSIKHILFISPYKFLVKVLVSSENVLCIHNNYIVVAWIRRCEGVEISNKTLTMWVNNFGNESVGLKFVLTST